MIVQKLVELLADGAHFELGLEVDLVIVFGAQPVALFLAVLAHHDDGRLDGGEHRQDQVEQDERKRIERPPQHVQAVRR